jgi:CubicO group peptidase (beta-lactamase class C family)
MAKVRLDRSRDEIIGSVRELPLEFAPGEKWSYNNTGYFLLGLIIEKVSGKSYADYLRERIFSPLEMNATRVNALKDIVKNRATGYEWVGALKNGEHTSMTWPYSAGAIVSTVVDLAKWDAVLYTEKVLTRSSLDQMWTKTALKGGSSRDYGFGWSVGDYRGHKLIGHGGGIHGFTTDIARFVDDKLTVIVLTNLSGGSANPATIARGIAAIYLTDLADKEIDDKDPKTTEFFKKLVQDSTDGMLDPELFTPEMQKVIFPDRMVQAAAFLKSMGPLKSMTLVDFKMGENESRTYRYRLAYGNNNIALTGTLNSEGKISGLLMSPD